MTELKTADDTSSVENTTKPSMPAGKADTGVSLTEIPSRTVGNVRCANPFMVAEDVNVFYGENHAIQNVTLEFGKNQVIALIGPSGCGKSTFLRCLNRMNDSIESARVTGKITLDGQDIYSKKLDPVALRARVGMVFQKPNPFPKSIYENPARTIGSGGGGRPGDASQPIERIGQTEP